MPLGSLPLKQPYINSSAVGAHARKYKNPAAVDWVAMTIPLACVGSLFKRSDIPALLIFGLRTAVEALPNLVTADI